MDDGAPRSQIGRPSRSPTGIWAKAWREAGPKLEEIRRAELGALNQQKAIALLCGPADYTGFSRAPRRQAALP